MHSFRSSQSIKPVKRFISSKKTIFIIGIALLATLWQVLSFYIGEDTMVFPGPVSTLRYAFYLLGKEYTYRCIVSTMCRMLMGFGFSLLAGLLLGVIAGNFEVFGQLLQPSIIMLRAIPTASLVYLFIVLAGFKNAPIYLVFLISFPIIYEGVKTGVANVSPAIINATRLDGASFGLSVYCRFDGFRLFSVLQDRDHGGSDHRFFRGGIRFSHTWRAFL